MTLKNNNLTWLLDIRLLALLAGLITFVIYFPALDNGFVSWDDDVYLYKNDHIRHINVEFFRWAFGEVHASNWHPLTWLSHAIDYALWGLNPKGHHLTNNLLHAINTLLVTMLTFKLLTGIRTSPKGLFADHKALAQVSLVTGLLFGLHPLHVESVAWISERKDLLCAFFYLLSLLAYLRHWRRLPDDSATLRNRDYLLSLIFFALALMSKPMAISLPCVLLMIDWLHGKGLNHKAWRKVLIFKAPFLALALVSAVVTLLAQKSGGAITTLATAPLIDRLWVAAYALVAYLQNMVWPADLQPYYVYPKSVQWFSLQYLGSAALIAAVTLAALFSIRRHRIWAVGWGYYLVTLMPVLGIVKVGGQAMADRYTYLPSIAPFMLLGFFFVWLIDRLFSRSKRENVQIISFFVLTSLLAVVLTGLTQKQIRIWRNGETLWNYQIGYSDQVPLAYKQLGIALFEREEYEEAAKMMSKALSLSPLDPLLLSNLGICYLELGDLDKAAQAVGNALRIEQDNLFALNTLGEIHLARKEYPQASQAFFRAMQLEPNKPLRLFNLAVSFDKLNDASQACIYWRRYMTVDVTEDHDVEIIEHLAEIGCPVNKP